MKKKGTVKVKILRHDPETDKKPHLESYEVPFHQKMSVTNLLEYIYETMDPSIAFFVSCKRGNCGRCLVSVNGKNCLACTTEIKGNVRIEPAKGKRVIRDLRVENV